ncbi:hypothetical protein [Methylibium sp.]|uniref:hypothetical protein n=1 Tax=Methylibium sp. TaxID=2067992 RepID=UPI00286C4EB8|nr:hypothetical protein [Methylibium sp.]
MALKPGGLDLRLGTRTAWRLLALAVVLATSAGLSWYSKARDNALIAAGAEALAGAASAAMPVDAASAAESPALRFARAHALAERGDVEAALALYRGLQSDPVVGTAARYNSANLLMRQALVLRDSPSPGQAIPLIELAKQGYRDVLRSEPLHWDARYNYERAQRLQPDPDGSDPAIAEPRNDAERAATTMRGISPGLP